MTRRLTTEFVCTFMSWLVAKTANDVVGAESVRRASRVANRVPRARPVAGDLLGGKEATALHSLPQLPGFDGPNCLPRFSGN